MNNGNGDTGHGPSNPYKKKDYEQENSQLKQQLYGSQVWLKQTLEELDRRNEVEGRLRRTIELLKEALNINDSETCLTTSHGESPRAFPGLVVTQASSGLGAYDAAISGTEASWDSLRRWMGDDGIWHQMKEMHLEGPMTFHIIFRD
ncbi:hypothetical protein F53441_4234 [Fusarium austroafricanum]|uniref:Uncharacterized protein n=1 Tax=Fusarium austroafricanum TaxID=2364996 RepID=A0A8H4P0W7_9HYPO|nr:hypothetical protein F53441_4234 [Fusarium austroafricanum]